MSFDYVISSLLDESGVLYKTNSRSFILDCPRCGKKDKVYIDKTDGFWICWSCAETDGLKGSNPAYILHLLTGRNTKEIRAALDGVENTGSMSFLRPRNEDDEPRSPFNEKAPEPLVLLPEMVPIESPDAVPGIEYLKMRGIPLTIAKEYGIRYWARYRRILFPIIVDGVCYGFQARMIDKPAPGDIKILSSRDLPRRSMVMFHHRLKDSPHAVVCEGPIDAIKAHLCGGNIATMGKMVTPQQIAQIKQAGVKKIYFALDRDALPEVPDLARDCGLDAFVVRVPDGREDLGDSTPQEVYRQFKKAERVTGNSSFFYNKKTDPKNKKST